MSKSNFLKLTMHKVTVNYNKYSLNKIWLVICLNILLISASEDKLPRFRSILIPVFVKT